MRSVDVADGVEAEKPIDQRKCSAIKGAFYSEFIDMFDIYLPVVVMAPVLPYFHPPHISGKLETILASLVFITTLLGRPIGAIIFGSVADRFGRRQASVLSVSGFGIVTFLIALLPGYETLGLLSYFLLVGLRFIDGIFLGGGYTGSIPLAMEYSDKSQRGFVGGLIFAAFPAAYLAINVVAMAMFALFPLSGMDSPYARWGWRIPFLLGALLAGFLVLYYVRNVSESQVWTKETAPVAEKKLPFFSLIAGDSGRNLLQVLVMMTGFWLTQNIMTIYLPTSILVNVLHLTGFQMTCTLMIAYALLFFSYIASGMIAQTIGRRRFFTIVGPLIATMGAGLLYVLSSRPDLPFVTVIVLVCALAILVTSPWGVLITYINERFATEVRATGFGVGYSLSVIIPSFYAFYMAWIDLVLPSGIAPVILLSVGGLIGALGSLMGPETKDVDF
ncbi:MFS transporter [Burkholderia cepacia]|nr:MFS transporter [Burkholderia cepacia]